MASPKLPKVDLAQLETLHLDFFRMFQRHIGQPLEGGLCRRLAMNIHYALDSDPEAVFQTLMQYQGRELSTYWCRLLSWQLVGRRAELQAGPLQLFEHPIRDEWVPMEILSLRPCIWRTDQNGQYLDFHCLSGHPAGHTLSKKFPENWLAWLAYRIGYSRRLRYEYEPEEMTGLRFWGYLRAVEDSEELDFDEWDVDRQCKQYNQRILKRRRRFDVDLDRMTETQAEEYSCPFDHDHYCSECTRSVTECMASMNRERTDVGGPVLDRETASHS